MDDDAFVNVKRFISVLAKPEIPKEKLYMGHCFKGPGVKRRGKWKVSYEDYNQTFHPDFCSGYGIVLMLFICSWIYMPLFPGLKLTMFTSVCLQKKQV